MLYKYFLSGVHIALFPTGEPQLSWVCIGSKRDMEGWDKVIPVYVATTCLCFVLVSRFFFSAIRDLEMNIPFLL